MAKRKPAKDGGGAITPISRCDDKGLHASKGLNRRDEVAAPEIWQALVWFKVLHPKGYILTRLASILYTVLYIT
jgi:hypothetical protein